MNDGLQIHAGLPTDNQRQPPDRALHFLCTFLHHNVCTAYAFLPVHTVAPAIENRPAAHAAHRNPAKMYTHHTVLVKQRI